MAVDTRSLVYLIDPFWQGENINGKPLLGGYMEVYVAGTDTKYITWSDWDGARHPFRIPLKSDGRACILVEPQYTYDCYLYDSFGNLACSRLNVSPDIGGDVSVSGLTQVFHDETISGNGTPQEPIGVVSAGKVYEGIEPIVVNNDLDKISANHVPLGVQDPLYFVQDDEEGCIIGCSAQTEIPSAISGKWDAASDAVITNSAQWAENTEYEAGNYISIDNNVINVTGLSPVPTDTASTGLVAEVSADITAMIPDTSDMATQTWVGEQGYLTAHQSLDGLMSASLLEYSGAIITAYSGHKFAGEISGDAGDAEVNALVHSNSATWDNVTAKLDTTAFSDVSSTFLTAVPEGYATESWVTGQGYLTAETDWTNTITAASANAYNEATAQIPTDLFTKASADTLYYGIDNPSGFITGVPADMATTGDIADLAQSISETYQPIGNYQTAGDYLTTADSANFYTTANESGFITGVDLSPYQLTADMTAYQSAGNYLSATDSANFLLTSDSGNFYPMTGNPSGFINELPEEEVEFEEVNLSSYLQNTDLSTTDGKVTAISGIPLSAGGDVPEGVMVESGLEYNAVNEISGYNGSAIAQYGAEKQWLQHDDTIVHVANSAQYALGVNLSAVAQLLGVDETVLFSGSTQSPSLTDSIWNYKKILLIIGDDTTNTKVSNSQMYYTDDIATIGSGFSIFQTCKRKNGGYVSMGAYINVNNGGSGFTVASVGGWASWDNSTCTYNGAGTWSPRFFKVVGIGRKQA